MIPNLLNIESLDELMCKRVLTPMTNEENGLGEIFCVGRLRLGGEEDVD